MPEKKTEPSVICEVCKLPKKMSEVLSAELIREPILREIQKKCPGCTITSFICFSDLNRFRAEYVEDVIEEEKGELTVLEEQVVKSLQEQELLSTNINIEYDKGLTLGERLADQIADFGGSWTFLGIFVGVLLLWVALNTIMIIWKPFDPYPYIFLNLILSCLAAMQAPIIMMSQNRQEAKDRLRSEYDYRINLKAELEIRHLHEKLDHFLSVQWQRLLEIQKIQVELMDELSNNKS